MKRTRAGRCHRGDENGFEAAVSDEGFIGGELGEGHDVSLVCSVWVLRTRRSIFDMRNSGMATRIEVSSKVASTSKPAAA